MTTGKLWVSQRPLRRILLGISNGGFRVAGRPCTPRIVQTYRDVPDSMLSRYLAVRSIVPLVLSALAIFNDFISSACIGKDTYVRGMGG